MKTPLDVNTKVVTPTDTKVAQPERIAGGFPATHCDGKNGGAEATTPAPASDGSPGTSGTSEAT